MHDAITELKIRAKHRRKHDVSLAHQQSLDKEAQACGFAHFAHARRVLNGDDGGPLGWGKLLVPSRCGGFTNEWCRSLDEAVEHQRQTGGYVLPYQRQGLVVTRDYVEALGLDPDAPDWGPAQNNFAHPEAGGFRQASYAQLLARLDDLR